MTACDIDLETFLASYIEAALVTSNDESDESGGSPLNFNYSDDDIVPETIAKMRADCEAFLAHLNGGRLLKITERLQEEGKYTCPARDRDVIGYAGSDFWLTRNGHGAGFWETDDWPKGIGNALNTLAKSFGEFYLSLESDGKIHGY